MLKKQILYAAIIFVLCLSACVTNSIVPNDSMPSGAFKYTAYDSEGTRIVEGWFTLVFTGAAQVEGEWNFEAIGDPQHIGPQIGEGALLGRLQDDKEIIIDLNPGWADSNVVLQGPYSPNDISGSWTWSTIAGPSSQGTFRAVK